MLLQPILKSLACHDVKIREEGVTMCSEWLFKGNHQLLDLQKAWTGLFYCMWHSDKPLVQHDLARRLSKFQHNVPLSERFAFMSAFWEIMKNKWNDLDKHRLDKFYSLLRYFLNESLQDVQQHDWRKEHLNSLCKVLEEGPLDVRAPVGILYHISDIFLEELEKVLQDNPLYTLSHEVLVPLLTPFLKLITSSDKKMGNRVSKSIFCGIQERCSGLFNVSKINTMSGAFRQRQQFALQLFSSISQLLFSFATNPTVSNRDILYKARSPFENAILSFNTNSKKRKSNTEVHEIPAQKRKLQSKEESESQQLEGDDSEDKSDIINESENEEQNETEITSQRSGEIINESETKGNIQHSEGETVSVETTEHSTTTPTLTTTPTTTPTTITHTESNIKPKNQSSKKGKVVNKPKTKSPSPLVVPAHNNSHPKASPVSSRPLLKKRVSFNLAKNECVDYQIETDTSTSSPYCPSTKPKNGILKSPPLKTRMKKNTPKK